ncbi:MAG TPA: hypothetical protein PKM31_00595 [Bacillota bacterium]|jgi:hypothetical protein|nr:hypothetical protein [Bacillota bacterium]HPU74947.1 hypothetical protein [Bacillota bacterium]
MDAKRYRALLVEAVHGRRLGKTYHDYGSRGGRGPSFSKAASAAIDISTVLAKLAQPAFRSLEMNEHDGWIRLTGSGVASAKGLGPGLGPGQGIRDAVLDEVIKHAEPVLLRAAKLWRQRISARAVEHLSPIDRGLVMDVLRQFQSNEQVEQDAREMSNVLRSSLTEALREVPPYRRYGPDQSKIAVIGFAISAMLARLSFRNVESAQVSPITYNQAQERFDEFWRSVEATLRVSLAESLLQIRRHEYWPEQTAMLSSRIRSAGTQRAKQAVAELAELRHQHHPKSQ